MIRHLIDLFLKMIVTVMELAISFPMLAYILGMPSQHLPHASMHPGSAFPASARMGNAFLAPAYLQQVS